MSSTSGAATTTNTSSSFTVNGLMNAGSGAWTIASGTITIGSANELMVATNAQGVTINSAILQNGAGQGLTFLSQGGSLTLGGVGNNVTGPINVTGGNLLLNSSGTHGAVNLEAGRTLSANLSGVQQIGSITGSTGFTKSGTGTTSLPSTSFYTGTTTIQNGVVEVASLPAIGTAGGLGNPTAGNSTIQLGSAATAGTLRYVGTGNTTDRVFNLAGTTGGGGLDAGGSGVLVVTSTVSGGTGVKTFTLGGTSTALNTIGTISGTGVSVVKDGPGLWRMNAATKGFGGTLTVKQGVLQMANPGAVNDDTIAIGDTAASSSGVAAFLLEQGVSRDAASEIDVLASAGSQAVYLGGANTSGSSTFRGEIRMDRDVTFVAATGGTVDFSSTWAGATNGSLATRNVTIGAAGYTGRALLNNAGTLATTGSVSVQYGTAVLGFGTRITSAGTLAVASGATLGGAGFVTGAIGGAGLVSPGNSPGILTAGSLDPSGGTDFVFEITGSNPNFGDREASVNDVLRLTDLTSPFASALGAGNVVNVLFNLSGTPVEQGTFKGGFFTDLNTSFFSNISSGSFAYWVTGTYGSAGDQQPFAVGLDGALVTYSRLGAFDPALSVQRSVVPQSANFGAGDVSGQITQFVVVPEPMTLALAGIGSALVAWRVLRRRAVSKTPQE